MEIPVFVSQRFQRPAARLVSLMISAVSLEIMQNSECI